MFKKLTVEKKYDIVVREYSKGKYMMETSIQEADATHLVQTDEIDTPLLIPKSHKKVFEKVWNQVESTISALRKDLYEKLEDANAHSDKQEYIINILLKLDPEINPAWFYVSFQYKHMIESTFSLYEAFKLRVQLYSDRAKSGDQSTDTWSSQDTKKLFNLMNKDEIEGFDERLDVFVWKSIQLLIKTVCEVLMSNLPKFWKIAKVFYTIAEETDIQGQARRDPVRLETCSDMLDNIHQMFGSLVMNLFHVVVPDSDFGGTKSLALPRASRRPDPALSSLPEEEEEVPSASKGRKFGLYQVDLVPEFSLSPPAVRKCLYTHPVIRIWFLTRIMTNISKFLFEIRDKKVGGYYTERFLKPTVEQLNLFKDQTIQEISNAVVTKTEELYQYESWSLTQTDTNTKISLVVDLAFRLYKYALRGLHRISTVYFGDANRNLSSKAEKKRSRHFVHNGQSTLSKASQDSLRYNIFDALYFLLDGLEWLVVNWKDEEVNSKAGLAVREHDAFVKNRKQASESNFNVIVGSADNAQSVIGWTAAARDRAKNIDETYLDTRALIILGNLTFLKQVALPRICDIFEMKLKLSIGKEQENLMIILNHLDSVSFANYVRRKMVIIHRLLRNGILMSGIDWFSMTGLQEVRPYCHEILLLLVTIHAHISDICKPQVSRILSELLHRIAEDTLLSFRRIDSFNAFGMTQIQFLQDTLFAYSTDAIHELFLQTYELLEKGIDTREPMYKEYKAKEIDVVKRYPKRVMESDAFKVLMDEKDSLLDSAKSSTRVQLMCFTEDGGPHNSDSDESE